MKKIVAILLVFTLLVGVLPLTALADDSDFVIEDGVLVKYNGSGGDVVIPDGVTEIGAGVFTEHTSLQRVVLPEGLTKIGMEAFCRCSELADINIPSTLKVLDWWALSNTAVTEVVLPAGFNTICGHAFHKCAKLESVTIPDGIQHIGEGAFEDCKSLTSIYIPASVTYLNNGAFYGCDNLTDIYYGGTETQLTEVVTNWDNSVHTLMTDAVIHYNSARPAAATSTEPETPTIVSVGINPQATGTAKQSTVAATIGDKPIDLQAYKLVDSTGDTNYVKIRDIAAALDGTAAQFDVQWDGAVNLVTGTAYEHRNGQENQTPYSGDQTYTKATAETKINGKVIELQAFVLKDANGGESTYYKLRDVGQALGFNVGFTFERGLFIEPDRPYTDAD